MNALSLPLDILGRVLLGLYFLVPGIMKIMSIDGTIAYMTAHGVPVPQLLLWVTVLLQVAGGIALIAGWNTQIAALLLAGLTLLISVFMHDFWNEYPGGSQAHELQNFIKNLGIFAGLAILAARGAPRASLDSRAMRGRPSQ
jgi:putative oxidoreductase